MTIDGFSGCKQQAMTLGEEAVLAFKKVREDQRSGRSTCGLIADGLTLAYSSTFCNDFRKVEYMLMFMRFYVVGYKTEQWLTLELQCLLGLSSLGDALV